MTPLGQQAQTIKDKGILQVQLKKDHEIAKKEGAQILRRKFNLMNNYQNNLNNLNNLNNNNNNSSSVVNGNNVGSQ